MFKDNIKMIGEIQLTLIGEDGKIKSEALFPNLVVSTGKAFVAQRMTSNTTTLMSHIAIGTGTEGPAITDTILDSEIIRKQFSSANVSSNTVTYIATFLPGEGVGAITEAGIFNSQTANSGVMLSRTTFPVVNKESGDTLTITWNVSPS